MEVNKLLGKLKPFANKTVLVSNYQNSADIIQEIIKAHAKYSGEYDKIAPYFWKGNLKKTCEYIFNYLKKNVSYDIEPDTKQTVKSPSAIIAQGYGDCKHYSLFIAGILDSLRRSGKNINWSYRFANYKLFARTPHHVFVVADPKTKREIWIDPVLEFFDNQKPYINAVDKNYKQMALYSISGIGRRKPNRFFYMQFRKYNKFLNIYRRKGYDQPGSRFYSRYLRLTNLINRLASKLNIASPVQASTLVQASTPVQASAPNYNQVVCGFNRGLKLTQVAGFGCCGNKVGYSAEQKDTDLKNLCSKMKEYAAKGWADPNSPYYNEFFVAQKEYNRVKMSGLGFFGTTSIDGIGRRTKAQRKAKRRARRERRRSGTNCKGRLGAKIALTLARRAYLLLVRLNFKKLGVKTHIALQNPTTAAKIYKKWCNLGGKASLLRSTARKAYEKARRKGKVSGDFNTSGMIGVEPTTLAALWAQAQPVMAALSPLLALASAFLPKGSKAAEVTQTASEVTNAA